MARTYALSAAQRAVTLSLRETSSAPDVVGEDRRALEARAAAQKALATWHASQAIQVCREACGGAGYLAANRLASAVER